MQAGVWRIIKEQIIIWRVGLLPGMTVIVLVIITRLSSYMQSLEWLAFDNFLRIRPAEPIDERIVIVGINEEDIHSVGTYPIPDREIAELLRKLNSLAPRVIGLDIVKDLPVEPGHTELISAYKDIKNLVAIEKVLPEKFSPPPALSPEQVGFADQIIDTDGKLRRSLLATPINQEYKFSLSIFLAKIYLAREGYSLENGIRNPKTIRFGNIELPQFLPNSGAYIRTDAGGIQILLNFRSGSKRFRILSLNDIKNGRYQPQWIRDRIVIIGVTAPSVKDFITTSAVTSIQPAEGRIYGVELQAHASSAIISAVLDSRPLLNTWTDCWEYAWIICWGILGIAFARLTKSPWRNLIAVVIGSAILTVVSYLLLLFWGLWVPLIPAILVLNLNGFAMTALYQYDQALRSRIEARQALIERTFETIHNGPLQTLAKALKRIREQDLSPEELLLTLEKDLEKLNYELRGIYEFLQREPLTQDRSLYLGKGLLLNLQDPIHTLLYQVYDHTLQREFSCFHTLRIKIVTFDPIEDYHLSIDQKRGLCRFLEEALCNVGKHATGISRLEVSCTQNEGWYTLKIVDDGLGSISSKEGRGTQQFRILAKYLKGKFTRSPLSPRGTLCELSWPIPKVGFW
ncbi:MAG: CHASE2 domain-containing protein [Pelatocladus maniniholoensis HA4357-MV3]|jgi:CHASE2 domain-containing sensor protein|uniref:CHASE2 domain-containing protein n=1 Tax=Pelatocladus maniniholoensis HA4357-MV3 TaxID=1117104 RepID=A0A9E3H6Y4_9NOST|nr:CHASE2 domain-containing protein [Pelatocladus maniniholoensis HA4357-MV3]BAZ69929.1 putative sensor with CHASE2 domain protein [Fischerella sp. NIES-4106]